MEQQNQQEECLQMQIEEKNLPVLAFGPRWLFAIANNWNCGTSSNWRTVTNRLNDVIKYVETMFTNTYSFSSDRSLWCSGFLGLFICLRTQRFIRPWQLMNNRNRENNKIKYIELKNLFAYSLPSFPGHYSTLQQMLSDILSNIEHEDLTSRQSKEWTIKTMAIWK